MVDTPELNVRLVMERPDPAAVQELRARVEGGGLTIDAQTDRSLDLHGAPEKIEDALHLRIEQQDGVARIIAGPELRAGPAGTPVNAYIPRRPDFF